MKKYMFTLLFIAAVAAFLFYRFAPHSRPVESPGQTLTVKLNPSPAEKKSGTNYNLKIKLAVNQKSVDSGAPTQADGVATLQDDQGNTLDQKEASALVTEDEDGNIVIEYDTPFTILPPEEKDSPFKLILMAPADIGIGYTFYRQKVLWFKDIKINGDGIITLDRIGAGGSLEYKFYSAGIAQTFKFNDGWMPEMVYYVGVQTKF